MNESSELLYEQRHEQFGHLPGHILYSLAANESAEWRFRKAAVELLLELKSDLANKPELAVLLAEVKTDRYAKDEVTDIVETAIESSLDDHKSAENEESGPHKASVTTETL